MKKIPTALSALFALWTLAACASSDGATSQSASRDCFRSADASGYTIIDNHSIGFRVGATRNYILRTTWNARDLDWTQTIAVRSATGRICVGNGLGVSVIGGDPSRTYPITSIERASGDEAPQGS